jgi:hypothetical protein
MESDLKSMQDMWQIPYVCQFVKLFRGSLNMDLVTPEELEQAILAPIQSPLCSELMSKLLLKKSSMRRELPPGEGYPFVKWSEMMNKQILSWQRCYQKHQKDDNLDKYSPVNRLIIRMFTEIGGNPFLPPPSSHKAETVSQPKQVSSRVRETRSQTNSLPRTRKLKYTEDFLEQSSDCEEDDENFLNLGEIPVSKRVVVVYYLCLLKLETEEEMLHELNYVPIEQQRVQSIGKDHNGACYYYFNNIDCRIFKLFNDKFSLVAKTIDQVKDLIQYLQSNGIYDLSRILYVMIEDFEKNEQERSKKINNNLRKIHVLAGKKKINEFDYEDSDFSPVEDEDIPRKRGPGRPRKNPLPERKPRSIPETTGNSLLMTGKLKKITVTGDVFYNYTGKWELDEKNSQNFSFLKKNEGLSGLYIGSWQFYTKPIDETFCLNFNGPYITGSGENSFGIFSIDGDWEPKESEEICGEKELGIVIIRRNYMKYDLGEDSSCSENEQDIYDIIKPQYQLEFEEKLHLEHMRMPLKNFSELKKSLQSQDKRELRRIPFFKSEYLTN